MPVCPACKDANLKQDDDDNRLFVCSNTNCPVKYFTLLDRKDLKERR